jgi:hypothetical protein
MQIGGAYTMVQHQGRIQDLGLGGAWIGEGSGQSPGRGPMGAKPPPPLSSGGLRNYIHLFKPTTPFLSDQKQLYF